MTKIYSIYIKSHCDAPDFEQEVEANNENEAIEKFYIMLSCEHDREFIKSHLLNQ